MPMIELSLSRGALPEKKLRELMQRATKTLMWWEKIPDTPEARAIAWSFANELDEGRLFVGGQPPRKPRYRYRVHTIEGLMDDRAKQGVIRDLTRLTLETEGSPQDAENTARIWCLLREYPRANWGIAGVPFAPSGYLSALTEIRVQGDEPLD